MSVDVAQIFNACQAPQVSYRKLCQDLRQLQIHNKSSQQFLFDFIKHLNQILTHKKNESWVQRSLKLVITFIQSSYERDLQRMSAPKESIHFKFTEFMIKYLIQGVESKEKHVRSRICHILSCCIYSLDEMSDQLWSLTKEKLMPRLYDKEASVRCQAVACLSRFQTSDDDDVITRSFIELLQYDPSSETRRSVLLHININQKTLPFILERSRDSDSSIRRALYKEKLIDVSPLSISIKERVSILRDGVKDRDSIVSQACAELLFSHWIKHFDNNLVQLLLSLDVTQHESLCEDVLNRYFDLVPSCFSNGFSESVFESLIPETALIIRCYFQYKSKDDSSNLIPDLVKMAQLISNTTNREADSIKKEFIQKQLLLVMNSMDTSDEAGRRLCCHLFKTMLMNPSTPDSLTGHIVGNLRHFIVDEEELDPFLIEIVCDLKDIFSIPESLQAREMEQVQILAYVRCMEIVKAFLIESHIGKKEMILCILNEIVIPSINSNLLVIQTYGLECLGLICSLDEKLTERYMGLFIDFLKMGNSKTVALKIIFDMITLFGVKNIDDPTMQLLTTYLYNTDKEIQNIVCEGFSKLYLLHIVDNHEILEALLFLYFHPSTSHPQRAKQCLAYFVHMLSPKNRLQVAGIFVSLMKNLTPIIQEEYSLISSVDILTIGQQLIQITESSAQCDQSPHMKVAFDMCQEMLASTKHAKMFSSLLTKLNLIGNERGQLEKLLTIVSQLLKSYSSEKLISNNLKRLAGAIVAIE